MKVRCMEIRAHPVVKWPSMAHSGIEDVRNARWPIGCLPFVPYRVSPTGSDVKLMVQVLFTKNVVKFRTLSKIAVSWKLG
jgi:hypothetical protein